MTAHSLRTAALTPPSACPPTPPPAPVLETGTLGLPWVLGTWLPSRGLRAVTVGECLGLHSSSQWYNTITAPSIPDATWTCAGKPMPGGAGPGL